MKIILSSDHAGFELSKGLKDYLGSKGHEVIYLGPKSYDSKDDYPDFVIPAMKRLQKSWQEGENDVRAVLMCRNGVGVSIAANKFAGIRAGLCFNKLHTQFARTDDDINVLALPLDYLSDEEILEIIDTFLETPYSGLPRHDRRLEKIKLLEEQNFQK
jgi:ribose 5-phosphate isomerase B